MVKELFEIKKSDRRWDFPVLAGLCVGIPMLAGYLTGNLPGGKLASMAGLVILYLQSSSVVVRMITLMSCSFGILVSFSLGLLCGFNPFVASAFLGVLAFTVHLVLYYLKMTRPPGNFFFIMVASVALCMPYDVRLIPEKIGYVAIGTMLSCTLGLVYSILTLSKTKSAAEVISVDKNKYVNFVESVTFGLTVGLSLLVAQLLKLQNPYWVPTTCMAVMQGVSTRHVWQRSLQRVIGTLLGLGLAWGILLLKPTLLVMALGIIVLQTVVEWLVVRNYGIAVIFITILTIFLAESGASLTANPTELITARLLDIFLGSLIGAFGGWMLYNERLQDVATRQMRKTKIALTKRR